MEKRILANIKSLGIDMINQASSGHPGIVLGAAPIIYTLYAKHLNINPKDPLWINRDRFVMSAGHGSALLYATLHLAGFNLTINDLKQFRHLGSKTPGHPECGVTPGVDISTGPLGQGFASAVGMAMAGKMLGEQYKFPKEMHNEQDRSLIDYKVYVLAGDGDLMEGISYEAASLAGTLNLDNLIVLYDSNNVSLDGDTSNTFVENVIERFRSMGWHTELVKSSKDLEAIDEAIVKAKNAGRPAIIEIKTLIGEGSLNEGTNQVHGKPLTKEDIDQLKQKLNINPQPFYIDEEASENFKKIVIGRSNKKYSEWISTYKDYVNECLKGNDTPLHYLFSQGIKTNILDFPWELDAQLSMRDLNSKVLSEIGARLTTVVGGSADLSSSTKTIIKATGDFKEGNYRGRNIWFGVREGSMGAILNGLALCKFRPFGSTFLAFADYMKPAIRMSALMGLPVTYIFTHDSIAIGPDGPTHQPIEQLAMLRSTPNLNVYRPADGNEIIGCWNAILNSNQTPSALIISRDHLPLLPTTDRYQVAKGAYIVKNTQNNPDAIIVATGSEVSLVYQIALQLEQENALNIRVVSMPSMELFLKQPVEYQSQLLPKGIKILVVEAGSSYGWHQFVYDKKYLITLDQFGTSGTKEEVLMRMNFNYEQIKNRILDLLK